LIPFFFNRLHNQKMSQETKKIYDLIVIGSGPAGQRAAVQAAKLKKSVLVIERERIGGACLHWGTLPSKALREAALSGRFDSLDKIFAHIQEVIRCESKIVSDQFLRNQIDFVEGEAQFAGPSLLEYGGPLKKRVEFRKCVIAVGTTPAWPAEFSKKMTDTVYDSDSILSVRQLPKNLVILGAGVIGCEYASIFAKLGVRVVLLDRRKDLLRSVDAEITQSLRDHFKKNGIELRLGVKWSLSDVTDKEVRLQIDDVDVSFEKALLCYGRNGNTEKLNLAVQSISVDARALIPVVGHYQTSSPNIYAVGDVIGAPALAASSAEQGRLAACHAFGVDGGGFPEFFPYGIYTIPEISTVGASEQDLNDKQIPFIVGRARYCELARGQLIGDEHGLMKLFFHKENSKLLGAHILGTGATELVHIAQVALAFGATVDFFVKNVFNYPTLAEAYKVAAYNAKNQFREVAQIAESKS
jgi:NAD(P) transhydrogenase